MFVFHTQSCQDDSLDKYLEEYYEYEIEADAITEVFDQGLVTAP